MISRGPSHEVLYWRIALGLVGLLAPALIPVFALRFPWQPLCLVLAASGFFAGGFCAGFYRRCARNMRQARERDVWNTVWTQHPDCRARSDSSGGSGQDGSA